MVDKAGYLVIAVMFQEIDCQVWVLNRSSLGQTRHLWWKRSTVPPYSWRDIDWSAFLVGFWDLEYQYASKDHEFLLSPVRKSYALYSHDFRTAYTPCRSYSFYCKSVCSRFIRLMSEQPEEYFAEFSMLWIWMPEFSRTWPQFDEFFPSNSQVNHTSRSRESQSIEINLEKPNLLLAKRFPKDSVKLHCDILSACFIRKWIKQHSWSLNDVLILFVGKFGRCQRNQARVLVTLRARYAIWIWPAYWLISRAERKDSIEGLNQSTESV